MRRLLALKLILLTSVLLLSARICHADWVQDGGTFNVDANHNATSPDIAVDNNTPYVVWSEEDGAGKKQVYVKKYNGISWGHASGSVESLNVDPNESANYPGIAAYNGTPFICWAEDAGNTRVVYVKYLNGTSWEQMGNTLNVNSNKYADFPAIALDGARPYITWREDNAIAYQIYCKHWNGSDWEQDGGSLNLDGNEDGKYPDVVLNSSATYLTWMEDYKIYVKKYNGSNWEQVGGGLNYNLNQSAIGSYIDNYNPTPYVTWTESYFGDQQVYVKHYASDWILDGTALNINPNNDAYPSDIKFNNSIPFIPFHEDTAVGLPLQKRHLHVKHFNGTDWELDGSTLNVDTNYDAFSSGIEFVNNIAYVVWDEDSSTSRKVYCKFYVLPTPTYTPTHSPSPTITLTSTISPTPTITPTNSATRTHSPTFTHTPTFTPTPSITPTSTISPTITNSPTATNTRSLAQVELGGKAALVYPNPARDQANFLLHLEEPAKVEIFIYNITGELVAKIDEDLPAGRGQVLVWKIEGIGPGIYIADIRINGKSRGREKLGIINK